MALNQALSGLNGAQSDLNVIANNISNANTVNITATNGNVTQPTGGIIGIANNGASTVTATGNIALTNNNSLNNATLTLTGNQVSVTSNRSITLSNSTIAGNLVVSTTPSTDMPSGIS